MQQQGSRTSVGASTRCPRCAYPLAGLVGVPDEPYAPSTASLDCPECGLRIPKGSCCLVGSASAGLAGRATREDATRETLRFGGILLLMMLFPCMAGSIVILVAQILRPAGSTSLWRSLGTVFSDPSIWLSSFLMMAAGCAVPLAVLARRKIASAQLASEGASGGADLRLLVQPGALSVYRGGTGGTPFRCAAADVLRVSASAAWRFLPMARSQRVMLLVVNVASGVGKAPNAGTFMVHLLIPTGRAPMDIARQVWWSVRELPEPGEEIPAAVTAPTPSVAPVCPRCRSLLTAAPASGPWREPTSADVTCPHCSLSVPAGSYVLNGWIGAPRSPLGKLRGSGFRIAAIVLLMFAPAVCIFVAPKLFLSQAGGGIPYMFIVMMLPAVLMGFAMPRLLRYSGGPRPEGRFQPSEVTWIVSPGALTIVRASRGGGGGARARGGGRGKAPVRIPSRGITRFEFAFFDPMMNPEAQLTGDHLAVRGTAAELGLGAEQRILLPVHSGIDREQFARTLTRVVSQAPQESQAPER